MPWTGFPRLALAIVRKDWTESGKLVLGLALGLLVPACLMTVRPEQSRDFATGMLAGLLAGTGFGYTQNCFTNERRRGTLELLLSLPACPQALALAKYISLYSMVIFTVNVPAVAVPNLRLIYVVNAFGLFLATVFMAATLISEKPWAPQLPLYSILLVVLPIQTLLTRYFPQGLGLFHAVTRNPVRMATLALLLIPMIVVASTHQFARGQRP